MWGNDDFDFCEVFANDNHTGGIVVVWDPGCFVVNQKHLGDHWILLEGSLS